MKYRVRVMQSGVKMDERVVEHSGTFDDIAATLETLMLIWGRRRGIVYEIEIED